MTKLVSSWLASLALVAVLFGGVQSALADVEPGGLAFGVLNAAGEAKARSQAEAWLKTTGKADAAMMNRFRDIWSHSERAVIDRVADTLALGDPQAAKLLAQSRDVLAPAPTEVPKLLTDKKASAFFRSNLALAYARNLIHRRVYDEPLAALQAVRAEDVVDPASYLFHRAVCEHGTLQQKDATGSINRLLEDVIGSPERYKTVSVLMLLDMQTWKDKDLGAIARKMENIERRLDLARGGPKTQKLQKEVVRRLDEIIKKLENQQKKKKGGG